MNEPRTDGDHVLVLQCRTERSYECGNYRIAYSIDRTPSILAIDFKGTDLPSGCAFSIGPATTSIDLGGLLSGEYVLALKVAGKTSLDTLVVSSSLYEIKGDGGEVVGFPRPRLNRVPPGTVWGLIGYLGRGGQPFDSLASSYLDSLRTRGAEVSTLAPGDYGYFTIDPSGNIVEPPNHGYYVARPYIYNFQGEPEALREVVRYFGENHGDRLSITLSTWRGDDYASWLETATALRMRPLASGF